MDTQLKKQVKKLIIKTVIFSVAICLLLLLASSMGKIWGIISVDIALAMVLGYLLFETNKLANSLFQRIEEQKVERINQAIAKLNGEFQEVRLCEEKQEKIADALAIPSREIRCQAKLEDDQIVYKIDIHKEAYLKGYEEFVNMFDVKD